MSYIFHQLTVFQMPYKDIGTLSYFEFSDECLLDSQENSWKPDETRKHLQGFQW